MSQTREYEYILLKNLSDSDDEESVQEQPKREPINTLAIIRRLERQEQLEGINKRLSDIIPGEKIKYALPASAAGFGIASLGAYGVFLVKFLTLPSFKTMFDQKIRTYFAQRYMLHRVNSIGETCGELFPLLSDICVSPLNTSNAGYCRNLFDAATSVQNKINLWGHLPGKPAISVFDTVCDIPNLLGYCSAESIRYAIKGINAFLWDCHKKAIEIQFNVSNCTSSLRDLHYPVYSNFQNKTCGDLFSGYSCSEADKQYGYLYSCVYKKSDDCHFISNFSEAVAQLSQTMLQYNRTVFRTFYDTFNETLAQYNQTLISYQQIIEEAPKQLVSLQGNYQKIDAELSQITHGFNYSCRDKFISRHVIDECNLWGSGICDTENIVLFGEHSPDSNDWWSTARILIMTGVTVGVFLIFVGAICTVVFGTSWLNQRTKVDDLSDEDRKELREIFEVCDLNQGEPINEMKIDTANNILGKCVYSLPEDKQMLLDMYFSVVAGSKDIGSPFSLLPQELIGIILYRTGLFSRPPMDQGQISNMRFAFLMGREDHKSAIPPDLSNEIAHKIFHHAGIPARPPACFTYVPNPDVRKNFFTFFMGRDDQSSSIPEITPMNIYRDIYFHAGLFRQLSFGKSGMVSESQAEMKLQKKAGPGNKRRSTLKY